MLGLYMRPVLLSAALFALCGPALAQTSQEAGVTVLRGSSAPNRESATEVVQRETVYVPVSVVGFYGIGSYVPSLFLTQFPQHRFRRQQMPIVFQTASPSGFPLFNRGRR